MYGDHRDLHVLTHSFPTRRSSDLGQRNAIDGRLVEIVAEIDGRGTEDGNSLWGATGCRSIEALVAWKTGVSPRRAETMVAVAHRIDELPDRKSTRLNSSH